MDASKNCVNFRESLENRPKIFPLCIKFNGKLLCGLTDDMPRQGCGGTLINIFLCTLETYLSSLHEISKIHGSVHNFCASIPEMEGTPPGSEANAEEAPHFQEAQLNASVGGRRRSRRRTRGHLCASSPP